MKIIKLKIEYSNKKNKSQNKLFSKYQTYNFKKKTLITSSNKNSRGKTTLIRFLLYALGYPITLTDGMKLYNYRTTLEIEFENKKIVLKRDGGFQSINNREFQKKIFLNQNEITIPMINNVLKINSLNIINNLLGCFYIDQEKGWTLLNRGLVIGKIKFNITKFLIGFEKEESLDLLSSEIDLIDKEIRKINILEGIKKYTDDYNESQEVSLNPLIDEMESLETERFALASEIHTKKLELKELDQIVNGNNDFAQRIEDFHLVINYKGEDIPVKKELLKNFNMQLDVLSMQKNELELEIKTLEKSRLKLSRKIKKFSSSRTNGSLPNLEVMFSKLHDLEIPWEKIENLKKNNKEIKNDHEEVIKSSIEKISMEFWRILEVVLKDIKISDEYVKQSIVFTNRLAGITGTQLHKLTFSYKIALVIYIEKKLGFKLPFIIDSPRSGEISNETASEMLNVCHKHLKNHQLIISSVYDDYNLDFEFDNKTILDLGVVNELEEFIKTSQFHVI